MQLLLLLLGTVVLTVDCHDFPNVTHSSRMVDSSRSRDSLDAKLAYCYPTLLCTRAGGHCVTNAKECNGTVDPYGCLGNKKCKCCIPEVPACSGLFSPVGDSCLLLALRESKTWAAARQYCQNLGADLVVFKDVSHYADTLEYIWTINGDNAAISIWIGGSDEALEDRWVWVNGEIMPRGPPYWGSVNSYGVQPGGGDRSQNCAGLYYPDRYYVHDMSCTWNQAPLCQMIST